MRVSLSGWKRRGLLALVAAGFLFLVVLWIAAGRIASPERRELQGYHREFLKAPAEHGVVVSEFEFLDGKVPTLVVQPDAKSGPGERGSLLRGQLVAKGIPVGVYGKVDQVAVLLHGRNGRKEDLLSVAERMCAAGMVCVIPDLPSHGESPVATVGFGARNFERALPGTVADEAVAALGLGELPLVLWGMSMGGSFSIYAAELEPDRWERMVIVSSFDTFGGVIDDSWAGGFRPLLDPMIKARGGAEVVNVRPVNLVRGLRVPTLFVHGDADELIGLGRGRALYEAHGGEKEFLVVEGGTHSNVLVTEAPVYVEMAAWLMGSDRVQAP